MKAKLPHKPCCICPSINDSVLDVTRSDSISIYCTQRCKIILSSTNLILKKTQIAIPNSKTHYPSLAGLHAFNAQQRTMVHITWVPFSVSRLVASKPRLIVRCFSHGSRDFPWSSLDSKMVGKDFLLRAWK